MSRFAPQTPSQTMGPMYGFSLTWGGSNRTVEDDDPCAVTIKGLLLDGDGAPVAYPDAMIEVWQGDQFVRARTDPYGLWHVVMRFPEPEALADGTPQAPHLNVSVFARGLMKQANTRIYFPAEDAANLLDPVLSRVDPHRRKTLIAVATGDGQLRFDIHLQGPLETAFFDF